MNNLLNYLIEANLGLCVLMGFYVLVLSRETDFNIKRIYLLLSVGLSVLAPFLHFDQSSNLPYLGTVLPSLSDILPTQWLPEVVINGDGTAARPSENSTITPWFIIDLVYATGLVVSLVVFMLGLFSLVRLFGKSKSIRSGNFIILESEQNKSSFSF